MSKSEMSPVIDVPQDALFKLEGWTYLRRTEGESLATVFAQPEGGENSVGTKMITGRKFEAYTEVEIYRPDETVIWSDEQLAIINNTLDEYYESLT